MLKKFKIFSAVLVAASLLSGITALAAPGGSFFSEPPAQAWEPDKDSNVGYKIIPKVDITVTALGRDALGMAQNHELTLWDMTDRMEASPTWGEEEPARVDFESAVLLATVEVTPDSPQDSGFFYAELAEPIVLKAGNLYAIASQEYEDGDFVPHVHGCDLSNIPNLVNENIAYICEDAHNGIANGGVVPEGMDMVPPINWWFHDWVQDGENPAYRAGGAFGTSARGILSSVNFWYDEELTVPLTDDEVNAIYGTPIPAEVPEEDAAEVEGEDVTEDVTDPIEESEENTDTDADEAITEGVDEENATDSADAEETEKADDNNMLKNGIIIGAIVVVLAVMVFLFLKGKKSNK